MASQKLGDITLVKQAGTVLTLATEKKYVDNDVYFNIDVKEGAVTSGTANITSISKTYNSSNDNFDITGSADVSAPSVSEAGFISSTAGTRNKKTNGATVTASIPKIVATNTITTGTGTGSINATKKPNISKQTTPSGVTNAASGDATTTAPSSGVYVAVKSSANTGKLTATPSVTTAGFGDASHHGIATSTATFGAAESDTTYIPITTTSATVNGKTVSYGSGWITEGSKSIAVGTVTSGSANITSLSNAYNSTNDNFDVTGSADVSAPSVGTAGYVSSSEGTKNKNTGGATVTATMPKIVGSTTITGTKTAKPSITKQDVPSGVTQAASGDATTTAPSSGVYVAVKSAANTGTLTATPSVTTDGYGTSAKHGITKATATVGASASDTTYVPITTTSATVNGKTVSYGSGWIAEGSKSVADGSVTQNAPTIDSATGLITATSTVTEGYVDSDTKSNTLQLTVKAATTYSTSTSNRTIAAETYLTGKQTIRAVTTSGIEAENIKDGAIIKVGDSASSGRIKNITGTFTDASTVSEGQTAATSGTILNGYSAWVDGEEVQGDIATKTTLTVNGKTVTAPAGFYPNDTSASVSVGTVTSGTATITSITKAYNSTTGKFDIAGSADVSAPIVGTAGYISSSEGTRNTKTGGATVSATIDKIVATTTFSGTTTTKPSISVQNVPTGVTNASTGNATTTAPTSGVYVAVKSAANTGTITATPTVTTAGYGDATNNGISGNSTAVGADASDTTYVRVMTATPAFDGGVLSGGSTARGTNVSLSTTDNGMKVQTAYTASRTAVLYNGAVNGWVTKADDAQALAGATSSSTDGTAYYVTAVTMPKDKGFTVTTTADTELDTTSDLDVTNNAYRRVDITNNENGTVKINNTGNVTVMNTATDTGEIQISARVTPDSVSLTSGTVVTNGLWKTTEVNAGGTYFGRVTVASGSATTPATTISSAPSISIDANGLITATNSKTQSVTPTVSAGYVAYGTAGTITVGGSNTKQMTTKAATTYNVSTSNQTIASGTYLTGTQTFRAVTTSGIDAANIKDGAIVKVGDAGSATRIKNVTGTFTDAATVSSGQTAAAAGQIRSGYSAWVDGAEVKGTLPNSAVTEGETTVNGTTATRGKWSQTGGYTSARTIDPATFASSATSGIDYVDISSTEEAPVLVAGDSLYINKGYTDNLKISLAKLVPDGSDVKGHGDYLLSGHSAYDNDGTLVAGTIQSMAGGTKYATTSNQTISTSGKYLTSDIVVNKLSSTNYSAANIKNGTTISISNGSSNVFSVAGTFTKASTVSSGQTAATASQMLSGYSAWVDGAEVKGNIATKTSADLTKSGATVTAPAGYYAEAASATISNGTITSGSATISSATYSYNSTNDNFSVAGSATVSAPTVGTAGYVSSSAGTKNTNTATLSTTVAKIVGATTITGTTTKKPSITKQAISISGVTDAASGAATTTAPSSGVYVAVKSAASTGTLTATPSITTAGYGTADNHGIAAQTATVGASASSVTYIPITTANPTFDGGTLSGGSTATGTNVTLSTTDNGMKVQTAYTAASTAVLYNGAVNGWVSKSDNAQALAPQSKDSTNGTAYYVTAVTMPKDKGFTVTTTADTALDTTSDLDVTNNAYRRVDITNNANGSVIVNGAGSTTFTAGSATTGNLTVSAYNASGTAENSKSIVSAGKWVATSVSASGTYYGRVTVGSGDITPITANNGLNTYFDPGTSSDYNVSITPQYTNTAGYIAAHSTATSGTAVYYKIKTASPAFTGGGLSGTATASSSTASLSDSTNNSGISLATACTATRANVTYNGAVNGWVSKSSGTVALSSDTGAMTAKTYYINGVTMSKPSSGTRTFTVTAPGGTDNHTYTFTTDANGRTTIKIDNTLTMEWNDVDESLDFVYT